MADREDHLRWLVVPADAVAERIAEELTGQYRDLTAYPALTTVPRGGCTSLSVMPGQPRRARRMDWPGW